MIQKLFRLYNQVFSLFTWKSLFLGLVMVLALAFLTNSLSRPVEAKNPPPPDKAKIGRGVTEVLQKGGKAFVVVALVEPPSLSSPSSMEASQIDIIALRKEVASIQNSLLSTLTPADFRVKNQYQAVPALAGRVMSKAGLAKLAAHPNVRKIDLDAAGRGSLATSVPLIGANTQHALGFTGEGVVVAVLDSGLDTGHDDLADDLIHQECFLDNDGSIDGVGSCPGGSDRQSGAGAAEDGAGHGTHVTGIITSKGTVSSAGVAPDAQIVAIKVLDDTPFSGVFSFFSEIVAALDFIINTRPDVKVINMNLGTNRLFSGDCDESASFNMAGAAAINTLRANGVIAFASSDNDGSDTQMSSPACLSNVVSDEI